MLGIIKHLYICPTKKETMKIINIESNRIATIELTYAEHHQLEELFSSYEERTKRAYLKNMITVLSMANGNTLNREITINNLVASVIEGEISELKSRFRKDKKEYGLDLLGHEKRQTLNQFLKAVRGLNK